MENTEKESPIYEEPKCLSEILDRLLTPTERFLVKADHPLLLHNKKLEVWGQLCPRISEDEYDE